ncbi:MAG: hypothetical protein ACK5LT_03290 [Lachnospirales bacterium]
MLKNTIFGILSIAFVAILIAINVSITSPESSGIDLSSLSLINSANAEQGDDYTRSVRNYNLVVTPEYNYRKYDEDDCTKKWCEYYTLSGWCYFYD